MAPFTFRERGRQSVTVRSVDIERFLEALEEGAVAFDVRTQAQHQRDGLPGTKVLNLEAIQAGELPKVSKETPIYLVCERGQVSELAGLYLEAAGFEEVYNVTGGMIAWRSFESSNPVKLDEL